MNEYRYNGFLNIYKPPGRSSMAAVSKVRGILGMRKVGHAGTLDPMADGVLPIALGRACKDVDAVGDGRKVYRAVMLLGETSDTEDATGTILSRHEGALPSKEAVRAVCESFIGGYDQVPPMYSARYHNGVRLYELARKGVEVERPAKHIDIFSLEIRSMELPRVTFDVCCSKGTYIRTLCTDIGRKLGCGALMEKLTRLSVGDYVLEDALDFEALERIRDEGTLDDHLRIDVPTALILGKFDGTHRGHRELHRQLRKTAQRLRLRMLALILDTGGNQLTDMDETRKALYELDTDYVIRMNLNEELKNMSAEDFLKKILIGRFHMKAIVGGPDLSFGRGREGNAEFLRAHAAEYGYEVVIVKKLQEVCDGKLQDISSTLIREQLSAGDREEAEKLLGRVLDS